jgi:hypothetical protein
MPRMRFLPLKQRFLFRHPEQSASLYSDVEEESGGERGGLQNPSHKYDNVCTKEQRWVGGTWVEREKEEERGKGVPSATTFQFDSERRREGGVCVSFRRERREKM